MRINFGEWAATLAGSLVAALLTAQPGLAQDTESVEEFYKDSVVTILIGHPPGGSYDLYAQLASQYLGKYIPGNPSVIVQGMPGGGGQLAAAQLANRSPCDGSLIALLPETLAHTQLLEPEAVKWDMRQLRYVGSLAPVTSVLMGREGSAVKTVEDAYEHETFVGCTGQTVSSSQGPAILNYFTDMNLKIICGYEGGSATVLALLRGELDWNAAAWTAWKAGNEEDIKSGRIFPLIQFGLKRLPDLPDVPTMDELVKDPDAIAAIRLFASSNDIGRALLAPPEVPEDRFNALAKAFDDMVKDPEFLKDAEFRKAPIDPKSASQMRTIVDEIFKASPDVVTLLKKAIDNGFN